MLVICQVLIIKRLGLFDQSLYLWQKFRLLLKVRILDWQNY